MIGLIDCHLKYVNMITESLLKPAFSIVPSQNDEGWMTSYDAAQFRAACAEHLATTAPTSKYWQRVHDTRHGYHNRGFVHTVPPIHRPSSLVDPAALVTRSNAGRESPWLGRIAPHVPQSNLENSTAALEAQRDFAIDPV